MVEDDDKGFGASGTNSSHVTAATCRWKVEEGVHRGQLLSLVNHCGPLLQSEEATS